MSRLLVAFVSGLVFALGLAVSGMTLPTKVIGFLDVSGSWDPSLGLVMVGAIGVHFALSRRTWSRGRPLFDSRFHLSSLRQVDARLLVGAALFGVGWGLGGYCPGPAVVASAVGLPNALLFLFAMGVGISAWHAVEAHYAQPQRAPVPAPALASRADDAVAVGVELEVNVQDVKIVEGERPLP